MTPPPSPLVLSGCKFSGLRSTLGEKTKGALSEATVPCALTQVDKKDGPKAPSQETVHPEGKETWLLNCLSSNDLSDRGCMDPKDTVSTGQTCPSLSPQIHATIHKGGKATG